jgi:hypothetical protein
VISPTQRPLPDNIHHSQQTDIHNPSGIRTRNPNKRAAAELCLKPRGHWDRLHFHKPGEKMGLCLERKGTEPVYRPQASLWFSYEEAMPHIITELDTTTKVGVVMQSIINYLSINSLAPFHILNDLQWMTKFIASVSHLCFTVGHKNLQGNQDGLTTVTHHLLVRINSVNEQRGRTNVMRNAWTISLR